MMREYRTIDKSEWAPGPWKDEPDKVQWTDEATGLPCLAVRHSHSGHWCGYAGVHATHRLHGKDYDSVYGEVEINVHGGLTFAAGCSHGDESKSICHVPEPGEPDDVWWFGFDCAHCDDLSPAPEMVRFRALQHGIYRTLDYVRGECAQLARALKDAEVLTDGQAGPV